MKSIPLFWQTRRRGELGIQASASKDELLRGAEGLPEVEEDLGVAPAVVEVDPAGVVADPEGAEVAVAEATAVSAGSPTLGCVGLQKDQVNQR